MSPTETYAVTRGSLARVVVCAGEQRSGKTTLLTSIYEAFQEGEFGNLIFAGSRTLHGFERRCHLSRCASDLERPDTDRTKPGEGFQFLHLRVWEPESDKQTDLLFGDMSGELYKALRDSSDECRKYPFLARIQDFVVLLDGRKIADGEHGEAYAHARSLVVALLDSGALGAHSRVTLLTTKWDLLQSPEHKPARDRVDALEKHFRETLQARLGSVLCLRSAARPEKGDTLGLDTLMRSWLDAPELLLPRSSPLASTPAERSFDNFAELRRPASGWPGSW